MNELLTNLDKVHTTEMGIERIKRNLSLDTDDVVEWCKDKIKSSSADIRRNGKNSECNRNSYLTNAEIYVRAITGGYKWQFQI
ncbi:MAG: DUF3781 domain-containing protein [Lachnospiraceae bacterium]|nr:DUF3781 domain-containing protein [Lachnospiraceae bacterium]MDD3617256.1 DUF3781 domain-containing protein [Lachnospiraceae bacterium]